MLETPTPVTPHPSLPPTTTHQEDVVVTRQSRISLIWEITQSAISLLITLAIVYMAVSEKTSEVLTSAFFLIIGFYFSRTNHTAIGGLGKKSYEDDPYRGR